MTRIMLATAVLAAGLTCSVAAFAHAHLVSSAPASDAVVPAAPAEIVIHYTEGVEPAFSAIEVLDSTGSHVESGKAHTAPDDNKTLIVRLKLLKPGSYKVVWHATAVDTHKTEGTFSFSVKP